MLEIRDLSKIYTTVKGVKQQALDKVSLKFEETGMVFILGKSGSGKSTLLNLLGGLDKYDSGEIIIKGKSSKDFKNRDFDSYRNTYLGFIFQEFYIIEDFTVEQNIALALKLQHRKADKSTVEAILKSVDLDGYSQRKPNELSGGQKQRVAIARALIKSPEIIMADEPTGSLDSATGKQMFEALKKLSKEKLVLIVSHDRESAEIYGDRIIELADGVVINDIKRVSADNTTGYVKTEKYEYLKNSYVHINNGKALDSNDIQEISKILLETEGEIFISVDNKLSKQLHTNYNTKNEKTSTKFISTEKAKNEYKEYKKDDFKLIKSKLPFKEAFLMGANGLKRKKIRLAFTILLSVIAFVLFGVADAISSYNNAQALYDALNNAGITRVGVSAYKATETQWGTQKDDISFDNDMLKGFENNFSEYTFDKVYRYKYSNDIKSTIQELLYNNDNNDLQDKHNIMYSPYYSPFFNTYQRSNQGFVSVDFSKTNFTFKTINSRKPQAANEILITEYLAGIFVDLSLYSSFNEIIGTDLIICNTNFKISGIIDLDLDKYTALKDNNYDYSLFEQFISLLSANEMIYITPEATEILGLNFISAQGSFINHSDNLIIKPISDIGNKNINFAENKTLQTLNNTDVVIDGLYKQAFLNNSYYPMYDYINQKMEYDFNSEFDGGDYFALLETFKQQNITTYAEQYITDNYIALVDNIKNNLKNNQLNLHIYQSYESQQYTLDFAGFVVLDNYQQYLLDTFIYFKNNNDYYNYEEDKFIYYITDEIFNEISEMMLYKPNEPSSLFFNLSGNSTRDLRLLEYINNNDYMHITPVSTNLYFIDNTAKILSQVFLYVSIAFCVFAGLLLLNFISVSVSYKKKEIGILRALGSRQIDVFSIFTFEGLIIAAIELFISIIGAFILTNILSAEIGKQLIELMNLETTFTLFFFTIRQAVIMIGLAIGVVLLASFIPVKKIASMKPIDAIKDK